MADAIYTAQIVARVVDLRKAADRQMEALLRLSPQVLLCSQSKHLRQGAPELESRCNESAIGWLEATVLEVGLRLLGRDTTKRDLLLFRDPGEHRGVLDVEVVL